MLSVEADPTNTRGGRSDAGIAGVDVSWMSMTMSEIQGAESFYHADGPPLVSPCRSGYRLVFACECGSVHSFQGCIAGVEYVWLSHQNRRAQG